jgi:hypothetical protein
MPSVQEAGKLYRSMQAWILQSAQSTTQSRGRCVSPALTRTDTRFGRTVRVFRQELTLEGAVGSLAYSLEASMRATIGTPLGCPLPLTG